MDAANIVTIIVAVISAIATITTCIITNNKATQKMSFDLERQQLTIKSELDKNQAVTQTKLEVLAEEVGKHNTFAIRIPAIEEQIKMLNSRVDKLES